MVVPLEGSARRHLVRVADPMRFRFDKNETALEDSAPGRVLEEDDAEAREHLAEPRLVSAETEAWPRSKPAAGWSRRHWLRRHFRPISWCWFCMGERVQRDGCWQRGGSRGSPGHGARPADPDPCPLLAWLGRLLPERRMAERLVRPQSGPRASCSCSCLCGGGHVVKHHPVALPPASAILELRRTGRVVRPGQIACRLFG